MTTRPLALVTGASSGIGFELARCCAEDGYDLLVVADEDLQAAVATLQATGAQVHAVQADLASAAGVDQVLAALEGRSVQALLANAGHGLGHAFLEQDFQAVRHVIDTNITGTLYLIHQVARGMRARRNGRILVTGSVAGFMPGAYQAVYNATKAFVDSFAAALRNELHDSFISVTCLMPGATDTAFFARADMLDTALGQERKADPAEVARIGYAAMQKGEGDVVAGWKNKMQVALSAVMPSAVLAQQHRKAAASGTAH
jgi:short-subunit dehydrogenase